MGVYEYQIEDFRTWHPAQQRFDRTLIAIAPSGAGKSTFILDCLHNGGTERGMVLVTSAECYKTFTKHFPKLFCHMLLDDHFEQTFQNVTAMKQDQEQTIDEEWMSRVLLMRAEAKKKQEQKWKERCQTLKELARVQQWSKPRVLREQERMKKLHEDETLHLKKEEDQRYEKIKDDMRMPHSWTMVWDDLAMQEGALAHPIIETVSKGGRHICMKQYFGVQGVHDFKSSNRDQLEWLAISPNIQPGRLDTFLKIWMPAGFKSPSEFEQVLKVFAQANKWLVINRRDASRDPSKFIYQYRASYDPLPDQRVGAPSFMYADQLFLDPEKYRRYITTYHENPLAKKSKRATPATGSRSKRPTGVLPPNTKIATTTTPKSNNDKERNTHKMR